MGKSQIKIVVLFLLLSILFSINPYRCLAKSEVFIDKGREFFNNGDFIKSSKVYKNAIEVYKKNKQQEHEAKAIIGLSQVYQALGLYKEAEVVLLNIFQKKDMQINKTTWLSAKQHYGNVLLAQGRNKEAETVLKKAHLIAKKTDSIHVLGDILNTQGNLYVSMKDYYLAQRTYKAGLTTCNVLDFSKKCKATLQVNLAKLMVLKKDYKKALTLLKSAKNNYKALPTSYSKAFGLTNIGTYYALIIKASPENYKSFYKEAFNTYDEAEETAKQLKESRLILSHIYGYKGQLFELCGRYNDALRLTRKASFLAQSVSSHVALYFWQWQTGRIFSALNEIDNAIQAYELAINTLSSIRQTVYNQYNAYTSISFTESIESVYFGLTSLLFQKVSKIGLDHDRRQKYLKKARSTIEFLKTAELQEYFNDPCVDAYIDKHIDLDDVSKDIAVLYVISFPNKLELLFSTSKNIIQYTLQVKADEFASKVYNLRKMLEKRTTKQYLPHARKLYDWLIRPFEDFLVKNNINTIIMVPNRELRTIPITVLHDGKNYLIEKYSVSNTIGLTLVESEQMKREQIDFLALGLSKSVQGYPPLMNIDIELDGIKTLYGGTQLKNKSFVITGIEEELKKTSYAVIHIASHGVFTGNASEDFILTWNSKLTMDNLNKLIKMSKVKRKNVEILALSACKTAAGDKNSALGMAGVAVKAGVKSALATLWHINDQASSELIIEFYKQLKDKQHTKAKALQQAQIKLIQSHLYSHPYFWAPFILIGNWL